MSDGTEDLREPEDTVITLSDGEGGDYDFRLLARLEIDGIRYAVLEDPEEDGSVMIYRVTAGEDGSEAFEALETEEESERVFYLFQAEIEDYEFGEA